LTKEQARITIVIDQATKERLVKLAREQNRSMAAQAGHMLRAAIRFSDTVEKMDLAPQKEKG